MMEDCQIVLDDDLLLEYYQFKSAMPVNSFRITKLLNFYKPHLTNVSQLDRVNQGDDSIRQLLAQAGFINQSIEDLANSTQLKLILSATKSTYPFVNILGNDDLDTNFTGTFKNTSRKKALDHIAALCAQAKTIFIYDKYLHNQKQAFLDQVFNLFPQKKYSLIYHPGHLDQRIISRWKSLNVDVMIREDRFGQYKNFHDRYLVIDNKLEIILSSGFDNLLSNNNDFTYVLRVLS